MSCDQQPPAGQLSLISTEGAVPCEGWRITGFLEDTEGFLPWRCCPAWRAHRVVRPWDKVRGQEVLGLLGPAPSPLHPPWLL